MKNTLIILITMLSISCYSQKYTLLEINAKWNNENSLKQTEICGVKVAFGWLEDQTKKTRCKIRSVPILILFNNGKPVYQWIAGIDFKLEVTEEDFENVIKNLK